MASVEGHSESIALQDKSLTQALAAAAIATDNFVGSVTDPTKLSVTTVNELIHIIRALEATMNHHIQVMGKASAAANAAASTEKTTAAGAGVDGSVEDGVDANRGPTSHPSVRKTLSKLRRSMSRLNGVASDGLTTTKASRSDKVRIVFVVSVI